jgi:hypothetical protein
MTYRLSLHRTKKEKNCDICGVEIPVRTLPDYAEYWRVKGGEKKMPRIICCFCHEIYGLTSDGWETHADGKKIITASIPF